MIDITKELQQYNLEDIDVCFESDISELLSAFNKTFEKIGKQQYKSTADIEEILEIIDEIKEDNESLKSLRNNVKSTDEENKTLIKTLIEVADLFEDIYVYSRKSSNEALREQMNLQWNNLEQILLTCGLKRFGKKEDVFNSRLHIPKETRENRDINQIQILEIIKSGYIYKGEMIRKAEVVVNGIETSVNN
ncbi:nucleotide exchange factor GrpE [Clostridium sp. BJN0013]|uniref:nucleotide exchange factor GrpE n=1 Tax=Clostridium sp. BJN0013 TaxID=3236840 RepID=UPI0034C6C14A